MPWLWCLFLHRECSCDLSLCNSLEKGINMIGQAPTESLEDRDLCGKSRTPFHPLASFKLWQLWQNRVENVRQIYFREIGHVCYQIWDWRGNNLRPAQLSKMLDLPLVWKGGCKAHAVATPGSFWAALCCPQADPNFHNFGGWSTVFKNTIVEKKAFDFACTWASFCHLTQHTKLHQRIQCFLFCFFDCLQSKQAGTLHRMCLHSQP